MMIHPQYDPVALSLGPAEALVWLDVFAGTCRCLRFGMVSCTKRDNWTTDMVSDLVFCGALGVIFAGRIGYVLFYQFGELLQTLPIY